MKPSADMYSQRDMYRRLVRGPRGVNTMLGKIEQIPRLHIEFVLGYHGGTIRIARFVLFRVLSNTVQTPMFFAADLQDKDIVEIVMNLESFFVRRRYIQVSLNAGL